MNVFEPMSMSPLFLSEGINLEIVYGPTVTVVTAASPDGDFVATGEAKLMPTDEYDAEIGTTLAAARALASLAEVMEEFAIKKSHLHYGHE